MASPINRRKTRFGPKTPPKDSWESWWAWHVRQLNQPEERGFVRNAQLDPSVVDDQRAPVGLIGEIARWWGGQASLMEHIKYRMPRQQFPADSPLGQLQRSEANYREPSEQQRYQPLPGPTPAPAPVQKNMIRQPGLLSKYRS